MTAAPDRAFARVVLAALAGGGLLVLVIVGLLLLGAGPARSSARSLRCFVAPVSSLDTVVHAAATTTAVLGGGVLVVGLRAVNRERARMTELRRATETARLNVLPPRVAQAAWAVGIAGQVDVVETTRPFGFAYGWVRPRICISTAMVEQFTDEEIRAVLHHERWHAERRDPARLLVVRTIGRVFGFLPPIPRLVRHYTLVMEIAADRRAVSAMGNHRGIAGALAKVIGLPPAFPAFVGHAEARIAALAGEPTPTSRFRGRASAAILLLEVVALAPLLDGGNLPVLANAWLHPIC